LAGIIKHPIGAGVNEEEAHLRKGYQRVDSAKGRGEVPGGAEWKRFFFVHLDSVTSIFFLACTQPVDMAVKLKLRYFVGVALGLTICAWIIYYRPEASLTPDNGSTQLSDDFFKPDQKEGVPLYVAANLPPREPSVSDEVEWPKYDEPLDGPPFPSPKLVCTYFLLSTRLLSSLQFAYPLPTSLEKGPPVPSLEIVCTYFPKDSVYLLPSLCCLLLPFHLLSPTVAQIQRALRRVLLFLP
jgi:hypothetical protein